MATTFMEHEVKAVYVGAGMHIYPLSDLPHINSFYYFDIRPLFSEGYRKGFIPKLNRAMKSYDMEFVNKNEAIKEPHKLGNLRVYSDGVQTVSYYTNTKIPFTDLDPDIKASITEKIKGFDTIIISGYHPDSSILDYAADKVHLVIYRCTGTDGNAITPNSIVSRLCRNELRDRFSKYTLVEVGQGQDDFKDDGTEISTGEQKTFDSWDDLYKYENETICLNKEEKKIYDRKQWLASKRQRT
jgi:hypothetical protein